MSKPAPHLENGSASPNMNGIDHLAAADAAKTEANAHFKGCSTLYYILHTLALT